MQKILIFWAFSDKNLVQRSIIFLFYGIAEEN